MTKREDWADEKARALREEHEAGRRAGIEQAARYAQRDADEWRTAYQFREDHGEIEDASRKWEAHEAVQSIASALRALAREVADA